MMATVPGQADGYVRQADGYVRADARGAEDVRQSRLYPRARIYEIAGVLVERLELLCYKISTAGSLRRHRPECHDIDLVAIPRLAPVEKGDLLSGNIPALVTGSSIPLVEELRNWERDGKIRIQKGLKEYCELAWPRPKYIEFEILHEGEWIPVDLYLPSAHTWATIMTIRTGSRAFSHAFVAHLRRRGLYVKDGKLWSE